MFSVRYQYGGDDKGLVRHGVCGLITAFRLLLPGEKQPINTVPAPDLYLEI